eukprot:UC4_evm8s969
MTLFLFVQACILPYFVSAKSCLGETIATLDQGREFKARGCTTIAGTLAIKCDVVKSDITDLKFMESNLKTISGDNDLDAALQIRGNDDITHIKQLEQIESVKIGGVLISGNKKLCWANLMNSHVHPAIDDQTKKPIPLPPGVEPGPRESIRDQAAMFKIRNDLEHGTAKRAASPNSIHVQVITPHIHLFMEETTEIQQAESKKRLKQKLGPRRPGAPAGFEISEPGTRSKPQGPLPPI